MIRSNVIFQKKNVNFEFKTQPLCGRSWGIPDILHSKIIRWFDFDTGPDTTDSIVETSSTLDRWGLGMRLCSRTAGKGAVANGSCSLVTKAYRESSSKQIVRCAVCDTTVCFPQSHLPRNSKFYWATITFFPIIVRWLRSSYCSCRFHEKLDK